VKSRDKYQVTVAKKYIGIYSSFNSAVDARKKAEKQYGYK